MTVTGKSLVVGKGNMNMEIFSEEKKNEGHSLIYRDIKARFGRVEVAEYLVQTLMSGSVESSRI